MPHTCANCNRPLCAVKMAIKKAWVIGEAREYKTAEQVMKESGLVCNYYTTRRVL